MTHQSPWIDIIEKPIYPTIVNQHHHKLDDSASLSLNINAFYGYVRIIR